MKKLLLFITLTVFLLACNKKEWTERYDANTGDFSSELMLSVIPPDYNRTLPVYLQNLGLKPRQVSNKKALLGQVLFYDVNLSADRRISCGSCHKQANAFADPLAFSKGVNGQKSLRNSMALANIPSFSAYYTGQTGSPLLLWDNRARNVAQQSTMAFLNEHEMGMTMEGVVQRVREKSYYEPLWESAYGDFEPDADKILECLTEFVGAMGSHQSKFDQSLEKVNGDINFSQDSIVVVHFYTGSISSTVTIGLPLFDPSENKGRDLFVANCSKCHSPLLPLQEVLEACNGLDQVYTDQGKGSITGTAADMGVFKSPSLRNIALTAPYMHDGRFKTLEEVVEFYSTGVQEHPNLHPEMRKNGSIKRNFTSAEKTALVDFLHTLTDFQMQNDTRFSNPFWH